MEFKWHSQKPKATVTQAATTTTDTSAGLEEDKYSVPSNALERTLKDIEENIKNEKNKLKDKSSNEGPINKPSIKTKPTGTPEYNPTPISKLKKDKSKLGTSTSGPSKYDFALLDKPASEQEYDPASNYMTSFKGTVPEYAANLHGTKRRHNTETEAESPVAKIPKFVSVEYTPAVAESVFSDEEPVGEKTDWFSDEESAKDSTSEQGDKDTNSQGEAESTSTVSDSLTKISPSNKSDIKSEATLPFEFTPDGCIKTLEIKPKLQEKKTVKQKIQESKGHSQQIKENEVESVKKDESVEKGESVKKDESVKNDESKRSKKEANIFSIFKAAVEHVLSNTSIEGKSELESAIYKNKRGNENKDSNKTDNLKNTNSDSDISSNLSGSKKLEKEKSHNSNKIKFSDSKSSSKSENAKLEGHSSKSVKETDKILHEQKEGSRSIHRSVSAKEKSRSEDSKSEHLAHKSRKVDNISSHQNHKTKSDDKSSSHLNHRSKEADNNRSHSKDKHISHSKEKQSSLSRDNNHSSSTNQHIAHSKDKQLSPSKDKSISHSKDKQPSQSKDKHISFSRDKSSHSKDKLTSQSKDKNMSSSKESPLSHSKESPLSHSKDKHLSNSKDKHLSHSKDKSLSHSKDKHLSHSKDKSHSHLKDRPHSHSKDRPLSHSKDRHFKEAQSSEARMANDLKSYVDNSKPVKQTSIKSKETRSDDDEMSDMGSGQKLGKRRKSSEKVKKLVKARKIVDLNVDLFGADSDTETNTKDKSDKESVDKLIKHPELDISNLDFDELDAEIAMCRSSPNNDEDEFSDLEKYFSDEDPFDECLRIFNEEGANLPSTSGADKKKLKKKDDGNDPDDASGKKRVGMKPTDPNEKKPSLETKPVPKPSPAQVMMNRYKVMQQRALEAQEKEKERMKQKVRKISAQNAMKTPPPSTSKTMGDASSSFNSYLNNKKSPQKKKTAAITVGKGQKRRAHTPTAPIQKLQRPVVEPSSSSKVPTNVRQRYLNLLIDECLKLYKKAQEAFDRATEEEKAIFEEVSSKNIYLNKAVNTIKRLRSEIEMKGSPSKAHKTPVKMSHVAMLDGAHATKNTFTVNRSGGAVKIREEDFTGTELYERLVPYLLTEEQLKENNFPRPDPVTSGKAVFLGEDIHAQKARTKGYEKICVRCGKIFEVYPNGKYPRVEECVYHWGRANKRKIAGAIDTRYSCCSGDLAAEGCQVSKAHVHETNKRENLIGYMKTIPCSPPPGGYGVYALDCEMVYTTQGLELARVTVVGEDQEPIYESLVKPDKPVVDHNTRFSGITEEDLEDVTTSIRDVQAVLLSLFTDRTILLGHSLESDLNALKLIHNTVVDTSIVFPHRLGYPFKRALKNLMAEYLKKIIQDDVAGHDSNEDAISCLQLMQYKLKEDARKEGRR